MTHLTEKEIKTYQLEYQENAFCYIGKMLNAFNELEKSIEQYIIAHFETNDADSFQSIVLDRLTVQSKKEIFCTLLNNVSFKKGFIKSRNNSWPDGKLFKAIDRAQRERNYFAHYILFTPDTITSTILALGEFRDNLNLKMYNKRQYDELLRLIQATKFSVSEKTKGLVSERLG